MDEVSNRCVVLKGLPPSCTEFDVREVLELAHGDFQFVDRYDKLQLYELTETDIRWIVLFKTKEDAKRCLESGKWTCNTKNGRHEVTPDLCSDCIVPDDWILNEDWVVPEHPDTNDGTDGRLGTVHSGDLASSITACKKRDSCESDTFPEEHGTSDNLPDTLQGAVGMNISSSTYSYNGLELDKSPEIEESLLRKTPPIPKTRKTLAKQTTPYTFSDSVQKDLISSEYLFGSGRKNSKDFEESSDKDACDKHVQVEVNQTAEPTLENLMMEKEEKSTITLSSYEMFESTPDRRLDEDSTPDEEVKLNKKESNNMVSDEAVVKCTDSNSAETELLSSQTTEQNESKFQEQKNETDQLLVDEADMKHSSSLQVLKSRSVSPTPEQSETYEGTIGNETDPLLVDKADINYFSSQQVLKSGSVSPTPEQSETNEGTIGPEEAHQPNSVDSLNQNIKEKESSAKLVSHLKRDDIVKENDVIPTPEAQSAQYVNINDPSPQPRQVPQTFPPGNEQFPYQPIPCQYYPFPMPVPFPNYPVGKPSENSVSNPYFPYPPMMMFPPHMHHAGEKNAENAQSANINPYYYPYSHYQVPPMRYPMYMHPQHPYPFPNQTYQGYDVPNRIARQSDGRVEGSHEQQEDKPGTNELMPYIYDEVRPVAGDSSFSHSPRKKTDWQHSGGSDVNKIEGTERSSPVLTESWKSDGNDVQVSDDEETHLKHHQPLESRSNVADKNVQQKHRSAKSHSASDARDKNCKLLRTLSPHSQENNEVRDEEEEGTVFKKASDEGVLNESTINEPLYEEIKFRSLDQSDREKRGNVRMETRDRPPLPVPRKSARDTVTLRKHVDAEGAERYKVGASALPIYDSSGNDEREAARNTVLVKGLTESISREMLELFFENSVKTGGGEIKDISINKKKQEAMIMFYDENDTATVLKRAREGHQFVLTGVHLDVCEYIPALINPLVIFVSNIAESSSEECLRNFIESKIDLDTEKIVFGETPGTAMLYFTSPPDVVKLQQSCKQRLCDGATLNVSTVEKTKSVKVTGMRKETSTEALGLYFENKRKSKGGDIEDVRCRHNVNGVTEHIVTFVNYEDAERVSENHELKLDGKKLTACLHYPCMELDDDSILIIPEPVVFDDVNHYILKFIRKSQYYFGLLQDKVADIHGKVIISDRDEFLTVECIVDPKDRNGQRKVKDWAVTCKEVVKNILDEITVEESKCVACEVWDELMTSLHHINVANPDCVSVFVNKDECFMIMVGTSTEVQRLAKQLEKLIDNSERKICDESEIITKKRKLLIFQITLMRSTKFEDKLKSAPGTLEIDNENREYIFKGKKKDVDKSLEELDKMLKSFVSKSIEGFPKEAAELTFKKEARDYVKSKFYKEKIVGVWNTKRSKEVVMYGRTEKEANKASDIFMQSFVVTQIELDSEQAVIVSNENGKSMMSDLERKHDGLVLFDTKLQQLTIVSIDKIHDEIKAEFNKLFDVHTVVTEFLPTQPGRLEFMKKFQRNDLRIIEQQYIRLHVQIAIVENKSQVGFQVKGKKDGCKLALNKLQKMLESVQCKIIIKSWAGFDVFLTTDEGVNCIKDIELKEKCVVKVTSEKIKQLPYKKDDKVVVRNRQNPDGKITIKVVTGSLVDENVEVIVNSTNKDIDLTVGMVSRLLLKAGGYQLAAECKRLYPDGINVGDVVKTTAGGTLKCKCVYHGLLTKWDEGQGYSQTVMEGLIKKCLQAASKACYKSIAFPALGTGALGFPADVVARTMFSVVKNFEVSHPDTSLEEVHFVVWSGDQVAVKAFEREHSVSRGSSYFSDVKRTGFSFLQPGAEENVYDTGSEYTTSIDKVTWSVAQGDLTKAKTEAIINSTIDDLNLDSGNISKAVLLAAGPSIQTEAYARKREFLDNGLVMTNSGKLFCQKIIHVRARSSEKGWVSSIVRTLETVNMLGLTSVAFPALGTGGKGFTADTMARLMVQAFQKFSANQKQPHSLKLVQIIIFDPNMVNTFVKGIKETIDPSKSKGKFSFKFRQNKSEPTAKVTMQIYAESSFVLEKVETKISCIHLQETIMLSSKAFESLDSQKSEELLSLKQLYGVNVEISNGRVVITGFGRKVNIAVNLAQRSVVKIETDAKKNNAEAVTLPRGWTQMWPGDLYKAVVLSPADPSFIEIAKRFVAETGLPASNIIKIERIQNATLYTQYMGKKKQMEALGVKNVEKYLWHGTAGTVTDQINKFGFDRNYISGVSLGVGVYFAVNASTSVRGYCRQDAKGQKYIYFAQVLTGDYTVGSNGIRIPPLNPSALGRTFDSTTDNIQNPNFFVIFHDAQAYPSYLITFK